MSFLFSYHPLLLVVHEILNISLLKVSSFETTNEVNEFPRNYLGQAM